MQLTIISDTHGTHERLGKLSGDVLIHCGDMFNMFYQSSEDIHLMDAWFGRQDFALILCTGGNHDFELQKRSAECDDPFSNAVYLENRSHEYLGVKFFGAPWVPDLYGQAFFVEDSDLADKWSKIPSDVDVLITHTPPSGVLDVSSSGLELGCRHLMAAVEASEPKLHCFGHVHASSGIVKHGNTTFINAALVNRQYELNHLPYTFKI
jgi:Icc-related predicted phosphoesterase